ncbi:MAG: hypothetical protein V4795_24825 [Pseudomonadota bacterium]
MTLTLSSPSGARLRQLLVLLLLALGLLAGVSVSQTHELEARAVQADVVVLPALKRVHELARHVDEQRGMAALHLTLQAEPARAELEGRLQAGRLQIERRMAVFGQRLSDDTDRQHHRSVAASLVAFWGAQDRLLAASRRAPGDADAARQARALLTGEAQQAFHRLRADIDAWWSYTEQAAAQQAQLVRAAAHLVAQTVWALAALLALALAMAWALLQAPQRSTLALAPPAPGAVLGGQAAQAHLQALNDAVAAARRGEPGRAAGLSAQEAQHLAEQVARATQGLRRLIDRPQAARSGAGPETDSLPGELPPDLPPPR